MSLIPSETGDLPFASNQQDHDDSCLCHWEDSIIIKHGGIGMVLEVIHTLTRTQPPGWTGYSRRIDAELLREVAWPVKQHPLAYICGPAPFVETAAAALLPLGYEPTRIKTERFGPTGGS